MQQSLPPKKTSNQDLKFKNAITVSKIHSKITGHEKEEENMICTVSNQNQNQNQKHNWLKTDTYIRVRRGQ